MAASFPTPSSDRDPGSRLRPGQQQLPSGCSENLFPICTLDHGERGSQRIRLCWVSFLPFSFFVFLNASLPYSSFAFALLSLSFISLLP